MKRLYLIRHAKSSWDYPELADFDRPLNKRGLRDAPFMGLLLREKNIKPDLFLSSPSKRTVMTAQLFAGAMDYPVENIVTKPSIYEATCDSLLNAVQAIPEEMREVALFCHNPAITQVANLLASKAVSNIPTCGIFCIDFGTLSWRDIEAGKGFFQFFLYPKKFLK